MSLMKRLLERLLEGAVLLFGAVLMAIFAVLIFLTAPFIMWIVLEDERLGRLGQVYEIITAPGTFALEMSNLVLSEVQLPEIRENSILAKWLIMLNTYWYWIGITLFVVWLLRG